MIGPGTILAGRYELEQRIGKGGFAEVYLATDRVLQRPVAVKVLLPAELDEPENGQNVPDHLLDLLGEARFIARHHHPNIMDVYDFGQVEDQAFLVMPYAGGGTLLSKIRRDGPLTFTQAGMYLDQMASALDYAHSLGIIHRDIKPQNVLLFDERHAVISDFGIAKILNETNSYSNTRATGTPSYMAPEQFAGRVSKHSDLYSLGVVLFQMLTGVVPFKAESQASLMFAIMNQTPPPLRQFRGNATAELEELLQKTLSKEPIMRPFSAGELARLYRLALGQPMVNIPVSNLETAKQTPVTSSIYTEPTVASQPGVIPPPPVEINTASNLPSQPSVNLPTGQGPSRRPPAPPPPEGAKIPLRVPLAFGFIVLVAIIITLVVVLREDPSNNPTPSSQAAATVTTTLASSASPDATTLIATATATSVATATPAPTDTGAPATETATTPADTTTSASSTTAAAGNDSAETTVVAPAITTEQPAVNTTNPPVVQTSTTVAAQTTTLATTTPPVTTATTTAPTTTVATTTAPPTPTTAATTSAYPSCSIEPIRGFGKIWYAYPDIANRIGCPTTNEGAATIAYQSFTGGFMMFQGGLIYVFSGGGWGTYTDTFVPPATPGPGTPYPATPNGYGCSIVPINGFGKLWRDSASIRSQLGCPKAIENSSSGAATQNFAGGKMYFNPIDQSGKRVYVLYRDGSYQNLVDTFNP